MALLLFYRFGLVLLFIGLQFDENGPFQLVNAAPNDEIAGPRLNITVPPPKIVLVSPLNDRVLLPCTAAIDNITVFERPHPDFYSWYRNSIKLSKGRRSNYEIFPNGSLSLPYKKSSSGIYRCLVNGTDQDLGVMISTESIVEYAVLTKRVPKITDKTVQKGRHLILNCSVTSIPHANITWTHGNKPIDKKFKENRFIQLENGTLIISNVSDLDNGKYKCEAQNMYSTKKKNQLTWNVTVKSGPRDSTLDGQLLPKMQADLLYVPRGEDLKLRCYGYTDTVEWYFTSKRRGTPYKISNHSNEIILKNASIEKNEGFFKCSTKNDFQVFEVIVTVAPRITKPIVSIETPLAAVVALTCHVEGNPFPEITWYKNGTKIENSYTVHTVHNIPPTLRINSFDLNDVGLYQCFAKNLVGEAATFALVRLRRIEDLDNMPKRPENVKCYPVNYKTLNVTFESSTPLLLMSIHFASDNPYEWNSTHPIELQSNSFLIITKGMPILRPFMLYMRGLVQTSTQNLMNGHQESTLDTSLLTDGVTCSTQGLTVNGIFFPTGIFIWWSTLAFITPKFYVIQFLSDSEQNPVFGDTVVGTTLPIKLYYTSHDVEGNLHKIPVFKEYGINYLLDNLNTQNEATDKVKSMVKLVVTGNVTGILIPNVTRVTVRALVITNDNKEIIQDFRYLEWKTIENNTATNFIFRVAHAESRKVTFSWKPVYGISCITACYASLSIAFLRDEQEKICQNIEVTSNYFTVKRLKPLTPYHIDFLDCKSMEHFGSSEIHTKSDPPGPIKNQKISKRNGLKLSWEPPFNSNGKILYYVILWSLNNATYDVNVTADENSFEFPNVTENDKINISIRVMGESGIGPPIFIDLRNVQADILEKENTYFMSPSLGIALGVFLSLVCILFFAFLFIKQRRKFKNRSSNQNRSSPSDPNIPITTTPSIELYEMQTLIPKYSTNLDATIQRRTLPNGNGVHFQQISVDADQRQESSDNPIALCTSTPVIQRRKDLSEILYAENEPMMNKPSDKTNSQLSKISSSPNFYNNPKGIVGRNETQTQNGSIKTLLPPMKHSISPVSSSEPKLLNSDAGSKIPESLRCEVCPNSNTFTVDNSRLKLLDTNLDRVEMNTSSSQQSNTNDSSNMTTQTTVNLDDTVSSFGNSVGKTNWNYHRQIIDPNG